jgi:DNA-directed RNA polymerase subunit RPC12/RpoP
MAAAANMGQPCPADPLWYRLDHTLHIRCRNCRHKAGEKVEDFALRHSLDTRLKFHEIEARLRCTGCGKKWAEIDVRR